MIDLYKETANFFQNYDTSKSWLKQPLPTKDKNLDTFRKINHKSVEREDEKNNLHSKIIDGKLVWAYFKKESKSNRGIKDFGGDVVGNIKRGDVQITRFAYETEYFNDLLEDIKKNTFQKDIWFSEINMELNRDKRLVEKLGCVHISSKITAVGSEVRGIYYRGQTPQNGYVKGNELNIKRMGFKPLNPRECSTLLSEIKNYKTPINNWSFDGINKKYGGKENTWKTIEIIPIKPTSEIDYIMFNSIPLLKKSIERITSFEKCSWIVIARLEPNNGVIQRHTDIGSDSWGYKTNNGLQKGKSIRIHLPIKSNDSCSFYMVGLDGNVSSCKMKNGNYYYFDKRKPHWVFNKSNEVRYNIILDIECEEKHINDLL